MHLLVNSKKKPQIEQLGLLLYHCRMSQKPERLMIMTYINGDGDENDYDDF